VRRLERRLRVVLMAEEIDVECVVLLRQSLVVGEEFARLVGIDLDESEVGHLLRPFVYQATGQDGHLGPVQDGHFVEDTRFCVVATVFGEEDGDRCLAVRSCG
jgi:hypothetical protein